MGIIGGGRWERNEEERELSVYVWRGRGGWVQSDGMKKMKTGEGDVIIRLLSSNTKDKELNTGRKQSKKK